MTKGPERNVIPHGALINELLVPLGNESDDQFAEAGINLTRRPAHIALSGGVDVNPSLAVRSPEPTLDLRAPVFRLADVGLAEAFETPAFTGAVFPGDSIENDFDLALAIRAARALDSEIHRPAAVELFRVRPVEESDAEVELGGGVNDTVACHTTLLS